MELVRGPSLEELQLSQERSISALDQEPVSADPHDGPLHIADMYKSSIGRRSCSTIVHGNDIWLELLASP